jgi:hypothetical protein
MPVEVNALDACCSADDAAALAARSAWAVALWAWAVALFAFLAPLTATTMPPMAAMTPTTMLPMMIRLTTLRAVLASTVWMVVEPHGVVTMTAGVPAGPDAVISTSAQLSGETLNGVRQNTHSPDGSSLSGAPQLAQVEAAAALRPPAGVAA